MNAATTYSPLTTADHWMGDDYWLTHQNCRHCGVEMCSDYGPYCPKCDPPDRPDGAPIGADLIR